MSEPTPIQVLETVLYTDDLEAARGFYGTVLGLELHSEQPGLFLFFRLGRSMLLLFEPEAAAAAGRDVPAHGTKGPGHVCFSVPGASLDGWTKHFHGHEIAIEQDHIWPNGARSLYVRDPAGNSVELADPKLWGFGDG
ncbi:MAG: VOC family protein [Geminicoccaceae bacterium]